MALSGLESRVGAGLAVFVRGGVTLPDEGRFRNSMGSRSDRHVDLPSSRGDAELRATWPVRFVFEYELALPTLSERLFG